MKLTGKFQGIRRNTFTLYIFGPNTIQLGLKYAFATDRLNLEQQTQHYVDGSHRGVHYFLTIAFSALLAPVGLHTYFKPFVMPPK